MCFMVNPAMSSILYPYISSRISFLCISGSSVERALFLFEGICYLFKKLNNASDTDSKQQSKQQHFHWLAVRVAVHQLFRVLWYVFLYIQSKLDLTSSTGVRILLVKPSTSLNRMFTII